MSDQVLLFSGGMDSFIAAHLNPGAALLYIDLHSKYSQKELAKIASMGDYFSHRNYIVERCLDLSDWERGDAIVPGRNMFFALIASRYGRDILLASTEGDHALTDKDPAFFVLASRTLTHIYSSYHFNNKDGSPHGSVIVHSPFEGLSKAEIVRQYLANNGDPRVLSNTISCYHPTVQHCGRCKPCIRKWVALQYNMCDFTPWDQDPRGYAEWDAIAARIGRERAAGRSYRGASEDHETLSVLGLE